MTKGKWIGVDLDGTLATHVDGHDGVTIGAPIPAMVERVKGWLAEGKEVRILTARVARGFDPRADQWLAIRAWSEDHLGQRLEVTSEKDPDMIELWDDRAIQVERNTGQPLEEYFEAQWKEALRALGDDIKALAD